MKKITLNKSILTLFLSVVILSSCSDFLDVVPVGKTTTPTALSDLKGLRSAQTGVYYAMFNLYTSSFYLYPDLAGNTINVSLSTETNNARLSIYNYDYNEIKESSGYWGTIYGLLVNVNNIIEYQPGILSDYPSNKTELEQIRAEALFFRALCHFNLCGIYGQPYNNTSDASHLGIPIVLIAPDPDYVPARNTVKEVYDRVIKDLTEAESIFENIPEGEINRYYANKYAVHALLSRVYLYMEDWDNAIKYSGYVINSQKFPLAQSSDYIKIYTLLNYGGEKNDASYKEQPEIIFRLDGMNNSSTSLMNFYNISGTQDKSEFPPAAPDNTFLNLFGGNTDDIRLGQLITKTEVKENTFYTTEKYNSFGKDGYRDPKYTHFNPIVFRSAEMYLNRAEAYLNKNQLDKAATDVKQIIARAFEKDPSEITIIDTDKNALKKIIEDERTKELCFEGHQLYDINRWGKDLIRNANTTSSVKRLPAKSHLFVQPIPRREMEINPNMVGNPTVN